MWQEVTAHDGRSPDLPCAPSQPCHETIPHLLAAILAPQQLRQI